MHYKIIKVFLFVLIFLSLIACNRYPDFPAGDVTGYKPVYATLSDTVVMFTAARIIHKPGKIYVYGEYLFVNEQQAGIHVFDNQDPATPKALGFITVDGIEDMAIKGTTLYANQGQRLLALDIKDINNIQELSRIKTDYTGGSVVPPNSGYYFECVDPAKGPVTSWLLSSLHNPECYH